MSWRLWLCAGEQLEQLEILSHIAHIDQQSRKSLCFLIPPKLLDPGIWRRTYRTLRAGLRGTGLFPQSWSGAALAQSSFNCSPRTQNQLRPTRFWFLSSRIINLYTRSPAWKWLFGDLSPCLLQRKRSWNHSFSILYLWKSLSQREPSIQLSKFSLGETIIPQGHAISQGRRS